MNILWQGGGDTAKEISQSTIEKIQQANSIGTDTDENTEDENED